MTNASNSILKDLMNKLRKDFHAAERRFGELGELSGQSFTDLYSGLLTILFEEVARAVATDLHGRDQDAKEKAIAFYTDLFAQSIRAFSNQQDNFIRRHGAS
jgi:CelD/BcsL family acetyltransferase involved in cellulose biosynthesis